MIDSAGTALIAYDGSEHAATAIRLAGSLIAPRRAVVVRVWESLSVLLLHTDLEGLPGRMREAAEELDEGDARDAPSRSPRRGQSSRARPASTPSRGGCAAGRKLGRPCSMRPTASMRP
jgi:hypothetical protein